VDLHRERRVERILRRMGDPRPAELPYSSAPDPAIAPPPDATLDIPHVWLSDPAGEQGPDLLSKMGERRLEISALVALTVGTLLLSYLGFVVGIGLVALSRLWDLRDKLLTMLVLPGTTLFGGIVLSWFRATRIDPVADMGLRIGRALDGITMTILALPLMVGWLAAAYLGYLLARDADAGRSTATSAW
jgi:hypothetical protein